MKSEDLADRLEEAEATLRAIREAAVDAFLIGEGEGSRVYMLEGADRPYSILIEQMRQGAAVLDNGGTITYCNSSLADLLKIPHERLIGVALHGYVAVVDQASYQALLREGQARTQQGEVSLRRADGVQVPVRLSVSALMRDRGGALGLTITDLTTEKHFAELLAANQALQVSEVQLRAEEKHQKLLIEELNHRVKNTLAVVQAFAHQTMRHADTFADGLKAFEARLFSLAKAHDLLSSNSWKGANLRDLVIQATSPFRDSYIGSPISINGPQIWICPKAVLALAMTFHELATNATKYGSLSCETGSVALSWDVRQDAQQTLQLRWTESGSPPVETPRKRGLGTKLIEQSVTKDISGEVQLLFRREGFACVIDVPLDVIGGSGRIENRPPEVLFVC